MKCWVLFENDKFVSKTFEESYANLDHLKNCNFENITDYKYIECDCEEDDYMYYDEDGKMKCCKFDKEINEKMFEEKKIRFKMPEPIDLEKENKDLKTELTGVKEMLNKLVNAKSFSDFKKNIT
jgi:hypothetical protein